MKDLLLIRILVLAFSYSLAAASLGLLAFFGIAEAQVSSPAFDPNCYQPRLGVPSEIDSVYGSENQQHLGEFMYGFPPSKDFPAGRVGIGNLPDNPVFLSFIQEGTTFDLHQLQAKAKKSNIQEAGYFGHFHDSKHIDMLGGNGFLRRIFWADDNGDFDSSRYTDFHPKIIGTRDAGYLYGSLVYPAYLTSDSVLDIVRTVITIDTPVGASLYFTLLKGGEHLFSQGKVASPDSSYLFPTTVHQLNEAGLMYSLPGDFRGTGREDLITSDDSGNWFFYRNDPPFSLSKFADALYNDTLMAVWENDPNNNSFQDNLNSALVAQVLPHNLGETAQDIVFPVASIQSSTRINNVQLVLRGSPTFGSSRIYLNQAEEVLHSPWYYDNSFFETVLDQFYDCGDMTGTGNHVLFSPSGVPGYYEQLFYVTGKAIDDKVDMYYGYQTQGGNGGIVPLDADGDKYHDVLLGDDRFTTQNDVDRNKTYVGTIHLVHGSSRIPVRLNPKYSVEERNAVDRAEWHITATPNPCDEKTVLTFDNCTTSRMRIQVYSTDGKLVQEEETPAVNGLQQYALYLPTLSAGMYIVRLSCPALGWTGSVNVVKTGSVQGYGNGDLKKLVGR